jgi:hypothetical protein
MILSSEDAATHPVLFDRRRVRAEDDLLSRRREFRQSSNGQVFVVKRRISAQSILSL